MSLCDCKPQEYFDYVVQLHNVEDAQELALEEIKAVLEQKQFRVNLVGDSITSLKEFGVNELKEAVDFADKSHQETGLVASVLDMFSGRYVYCGKNNG